MAIQNRSGGNEIGSVEKAMGVIEALERLDGARLTDLSRELDWPKSTVHSYLETLQSCGYVVRQGDAYVLGLRFLELGEYVRHRDEVFSVVEPRIESLAEETGERVQFVVDEHASKVYIVRIAMGENAVNPNLNVGYQHVEVFHATAAGKVILAHKADAERDRLLDAMELQPLGPNTVTDRDALEEELEVIRNRGYAFNDEEFVEGLRSIGAPVILDGAVRGVITVSGPANRVRGETFRDEIPTKLMSVCNEIELEYAYP